LSLCWSHMEKFAISYPCFTGYHVILLGWIQCPDCGFLGCASCGLKSNTNVSGKHAVPVFNFTTEMEDAFSFNSCLTDYNGLQQGTSLSIDCVTWRVNGWWFRVSACCQRHWDPSPRLQGDTFWNIGIWKITPVKTTKRKGTVSKWSLLQSA
jgi:hypothetical protein